MTDFNKAHDKPNVLDQVLAQRERVTARLAQIKHVVAVMSGKGGVGKSALTANLAAALGMQGRSVGVLDADLHGASAAAMLGARGQQVAIGADGARPAIGVTDVRVMSMDLFLHNDNTPVNWRHPGGLAADTFVWRGTLETNALREFLADTAWGVLDYLLIDMPPGADRFETLLRLVPGLSGALVVTIPSQVSYLVVRRAIASARQAGARLLGLVENMAGLASDGGEVSGELFPSGQGQAHSPLPLAGVAGQTHSSSSGQAFAAEVGIPYLGGISFDPRLSRTTDAGRPFVLENSQTPAGQAIVALAGSLEKIVGP
jgi:ATP-binding protein involved in chromosome partitioning